MDNNNRNVEETTPVTVINGSAFCKASRSYDGFGDFHEEKGKELFTNGTVGRTVTVVTETPYITIPSMYGGLSVGGAIGGSLRSRNSVSCATGNTGNSVKIKAVATSATTCSVTSNSPPTYASGNNNELCRSPSSTVYPVPLRLDSNPMENRRFDPYRGAVDETIHYSRGGRNNNHGNIAATTATATTTSSSAAEAVAKITDLNWMEAERNSRFLVQNRMEMGHYPCNIDKDLKSTGFPNNLFHPHLTAAEPTHHSNSHNHAHNNRFQGQIQIQNQNHHLIQSHSQNLYIDSPLNSAVTKEDIDEEDKELVIKLRNRESAKRSRARKQLQIRQLHSEVSILREKNRQLQEENTSLKQRLTHLNLTEDEMKGQGQVENYDIK